MNPRVELVVVTADRETLRNSAHVRAGGYASRRGTVLLTSLFMVIVLVALVWGAVGIAKTLEAREGLQDAADAGAYTSAIMHAKGMNLIALINLIMAALMAVLISIRLAQTALQVAAVFLVAASLLGGATAGLAAEVQAQAIFMGRVYRQAKRVIMPALSGLHRVQRATSVIVPWVALADGLAESAHHHPPAQAAFAVPGATSLPVEADKFEELCRRGGDMVVDAATSIPPIDKIGWPINKLLAKALKPVKDLLSKFLCGNGASPPKTPKYKVDVRYPRAPGILACETSLDSADCKSAQKYVQEAAPRESDGECQTKCTYQDPYESMARQARASCRSTIMQTYTWQQRTYSANVRFTGVEWQETSRSAEILRLRKETDAPPCGDRGTVNDEEYEKDSGPPNQPEPTPLCRQVDGLPMGPWRKGQLVAVEVTEAVRLFSCTRTEKRQSKVANKEDALGSSENKRRSPHKLQAGVELGSETFQIRAVSVGSRAGPGKTQGFVDLAKGASSDESSTGHAMEELARNLASAAGRFSVAQSEYYYAEPVDPEHWMWSLGWTARLRRFRMPDQNTKNAERGRRRQNASGRKANSEEFGSEKLPTTTEQSCSKAGGRACEKSAGALDLLNGLVKH